MTDTTSATLQEASIQFLYHNNTTTTETISNASASMNIQSGFANSMGVGWVAGLLIYIVLALLAAQFVAPWLAQSNVLTGVASTIATAIAYALKGAAASAVLIVAAAPIYYLGTVESSTREIALEWVGYALAGFLVLVAFGWLADRAVAAFIDAHPDYDEWGDLFPEEEPDAVADGGEPDEQ